MCCVFSMRKAVSQALETHVVSLEQHGSCHPVKGSVGWIPEVPFLPHGLAAASAHAAPSLGTLCCWSLPPRPVNL